MIEFNLLPGDFKVVHKSRSSVKIKLPKIAPVPFIIGIISVILIAQVILGLVAVIQRNRLTNINKEIVKIAPQEEAALGLKKEAGELSGRLSVIETLTSGSIIWSKKLSDLSDAMIDGVWLTSLSLNIEVPQQRAAPAYGQNAPAQPLPQQTMVLKGSAVSSSPGEETAIVGKFIDSLKNNKGFFEDFEDIKLSSIQRRKVGDIEVMDFTILCYFKSGRSYFEKLAARNS